MATPACSAVILAGLAALSGPMANQGLGSRPEPPPSIAIIGRGHDVVMVWGGRLGVQSGRRRSKPPREVLWMSSSSSV